MATSDLSGLTAGASLAIPILVSSSTTSGQIGAAINPQTYSGGITPLNVIVTRAVLHITTPSSAACTLDIGTAADAVTSSDNLLDGISVAATPANTVYDSIVDHGTDGKTRQYLAAGAYVTVTVASGNANGLAGTLYVDTMLLSS